MMLNTIRVAKLDKEHKKKYKAYPAIYKREGRFALLASLDFVIFSPLRGSKAIRRILFNE